MLHVSGVMEAAAFALGEIVNLIYKIGGVRPRPAINVAESLAEVIQDALAVGILAEQRLAYLYHLRHELRHRRICIAHAVL
jgi:hypothetical protein